MSLESFLDLAVLKTSGIVSSLYLSWIAIDLLRSKRSVAARNQALGFLVLFFISVLVYFVV